MLERCPNFPETIKLKKIKKYMSKPIFSLEKESVSNNSIAFHTPKRVER
jgi:hypothetical protein